MALCVPSDGNEDAAAADYDVAAGDSKDAQLFGPGCLCRSRDHVGINRKYIYIYRYISLYYVFSSFSDFALYGRWEVLI